MLDLVFEAAGFRLCRLFKTLTGAVEFPTVIRTANAFFVDAAKRERRLAVRALFADHAVTAALVAIDHQIFAQAAETP